MDFDYTSDYFYHFVGRSDPSAHEINFSRLLKILSDKEVRHKPFAPGGSTASLTIPQQVNIYSEELLLPTVTCFSDIPSASLRIHTRKYGLFGLSISRSHLIEWRARPVLYWPFVLGDALFENDSLKDIWSTYQYFRELVVKPKRHLFSDTRTLGSRPDSESDAIHAFDSSIQQHLLAYIKPFDASKSVHELESFYMEREWRRFGYLGFSPQDIGELVVAGGFKERLLEAFPEYKNRVHEITI